MYNSLNHFQAVCPSVTLTGGQAAFFAPRVPFHPSPFAPRSLTRQPKTAGRIPRDASTRTRASAAIEPANQPERAAGVAEAPAAPVLPSPALTLSGRSICADCVERIGIPPSADREGSSLHPRPVLVVRGRTRGNFRGGVERRRRTGVPPNVGIWTPFWSASGPAFQSAAPLFQLGPGGGLQ